MSSEASIGIDLTPALVRGFLYRGLLHNVGHYQLSHIFEDLIEDRRRSTIIRKVGLLSDGEVLTQILGGDPNSPWASQKDPQGRTLRDLALESLGESWVDRWGVSENLNPVESLLQGLMSSSVDIPKLAYLRDDSIYTGLRFGQAIDPDAIFSALVRPAEADNQQNRPVLAIRERSISYLEDTVLTRYWQIQKGYWQRSNRSLQAMIKSAVSNLITADSFNFSRYLSETSFLGRDETIGWLSKELDKAIAAGSIDPETRNPLTDYLSCRRVFHKRILTLSPRTQSDARRGDESIYAALAGETVLELAGVAEEIRGVLDKQFGKKSRPGDVVIDLPRRRREESGGRVLVYSDDRREMLGELHTVSPVVNALKDNFDLYAKRLRVFISPSMIETIGQSKGELREPILNHLRDRYGPAR